MDIEGYEYDTILSTPQRVLDRFRYLVIEFHRLYLLWSRPFLLSAGNVFAKLLRNHACVHIHPNNASGIQHMAGISIPSTMEFTFARKDRLGDTCPATQFPHPLDADNVSSKKHMSLPSCWYASLTRAGQQQSEMTS